MSTHERNAPTVAARQAVAGREAEILDALNIPWRSGRPHIDCPYPAHGGKNDWRWDEKSAKAHCTCSKAGSIFDVIMKIERIDFEAAKIRALEMIGRTDVIRIKDNKEKKYQKTDAASLLNAPADNRDDALPLVYLAHRLDVPIEQVPVPATPVAGLKALGYYDPPPAGSRAKPKLVGEYPCAVFGTIAAGGRAHAHRIYLAADGRGKAELGETPEGQARDPKKSAKAQPGDNTAGRAALWGDPANAPHVIITEGIETGAAVALALAPEIAAGEIAIAAAISAGGIEAFQLYPATQWVTIAADRDEAPKNGRPPSRRGEQAARAFGFRHHDRIAVSIALPESPGEAVDWLDVLCRDGPDAVRAGVLNAAVPFVPTEAEIAGAADRRVRAAELERIATLYPLAFIEGMRLQYRRTGDGRVAIYKFVGIDKDGDERWERKCTPIGVTAQLRMADADNAYGLRVVTEDMDGQLRALDFDRADLARMAAVDMRTRLFAAGLRVEDDGEHVAVAILKAAAPDKVVTVVSRPGWHLLPDRVFATPAGEVFGAADRAIELGAGAQLPAHAAKAGTLEGWQNAVSAALAVESCPHWTLGVLSGFAGPILALCQLDTCGINLSGATSVGKTTAQQLAVSAWSSPKITDGGLLRSMRSTENAVEVLAQASHGTVLALDEMAHADGKAIGRTIYSLAGNVGKGRMRADATMRRSYSWSTFAILSGETSLEEKVRGDGGHWTGGMAVRFADVDLTGVNRAVAVDQLDRLRRIFEHYGHAGPAFVRGLFESGLQHEAQALKGKILKAARNLAGDGDSAKIRAALPFALLSVAGQLAQSVGILPAEAKVREVVAWAWRRYAGSDGAMALDPAEQAINALRAYIAERWDVTIKSTDAEAGVNNREAIGWYDKIAVYLPTFRLRDACNGLVREQWLAGLLKDRNLLAQQGDRRIAIKYIPKIGYVQAYALKLADFGCRQPKTQSAYGSAANAD